METRSFRRKLEIAQEIVNQHRIRLTNLEDRRISRPNVQLRTEIENQSIAVNQYSDFLNQMSNILIVIELYETRIGRRPNVVNNEIARFNNFFENLVNSIEQTSTTNQNHPVENHPVDNNPVDNNPVDNHPVENRSNNIPQISSREQRYLNRQNQSIVQLNDQEIDLTQLTDEDQQSLNNFQQIFNCDLNTSIKLAQSFESKQKQIALNVCSQCHEMNVSNRPVCDYCFEYPVYNNINEIEDPSTLNPFCELNNMYPGDVPDELSRLSLIERILISPIKPFFQVFKLNRLGQTGFRGQVINFEQNLSNLITELPHTIQSITDVLIIRKTNVDLSTFSEFKVRRSYVFEALTWLLQNNLRFRNRITLNQNNIDLLPYDASVSQHLNQIDETEDDLNEQVIQEYNRDADLENANQSDEEPDENDLIEETGAFDFPLQDVRNQINEVLNINESNVIGFPQLDTNPINELTPGYLALAYPCIFPYGIGDINDERIVSVSVSNYFKHMILLGDNRCIKDSRFIYHASNTILRDQCKQKGIILVRNNSGLQDLNAEQLKQRLLEEPSLYQKVLCWNSNLRSSPSYWHTRAKELEAMVNQLKSPTLFFTLSAADVYWPELYRLLGMSENEFNESSNVLRNKLLNDNPHIVAFFFNERQDAFIHEVLFSHLPVDDYWMRVEFQHRGSPHIHGFLWLNGAKDVNDLDHKTDEQIQEIVDYFDRLVCACNNEYSTTSNNTINPCKLHYTQVVDHSSYSHINQQSNVQTLVSKYLADYHNLINKVQRHTRCSNSCLRKIRGTNTYKCRYKFPKDFCDQSSLIRKEDGSFEFNLKRNDRRMNNHMPLMSVHWRANIDVSPIISIEAVIRYIAKYASKNEPSSNMLNQLREHLILSRTENRNSISLVQSLLMKQCAMRDYSAQECIWIILGFSFYSKSRTFLTVNLSSDSYLSIEEDVSNNPIQFYGERMNQFSVSNRRGRPSTNQLDQNSYQEFHRNRARTMSMYQFLITYYKQPKTSSFFKIRNKQAVIRIYPILKSTDRYGNLNQDYFKQQLLLHVPWSENFERSINPNNEQWSEVYNRYGEIIPDFLNLDNDYNEEEEDFEDEIDNEPNYDLHEWMLYVRERPNIQQNPAELGLREQDTTFDWTRSYNNYENHAELRNFVEDNVNRFRNDPVNLNEDIQMPQVVFSEEQQRVLNVIHAMIHYLRTGEQTQWFRRSIVVQGKAGSGKTLLIKAIRSIVSTEFNRNSVVIVAPTGSSASNIQSSTIHSKFKISINRLLNELSVSELHQLQEKFRECRFLIVDEMSLVGRTILKKLDSRCRQIKSSNHLPFGGMFFILLGDMKQLPPVNDRPLYGNGYNNQYSDEGQNLFKNIESSIILTTSHRQNENQVAFRQLLDRLSDGEFTLEDFRLLNTRNIDLLNERDFDDSIHLFDTNFKANEYNETKLRQFDHVCRIQSINNCSEAESASSKEAENLECVLYLAINCRVMLRKNLWIERGLVNGAIRTVRDIVFDPNGDPTIPLFVMVNFDNYSGPTISGNVPIVPIESRWIKGSIDCRRIQLPLIVCYGTTIHKSQGLTLESAVVDIGDNERNLGLAYTGLSRVRTIESLAIKTYDFERFASISESRLLALRKIEERRLLSISL